MWLRPFYFKDDKDSGSESSYLDQPFEPEECSIMEKFTEDWIESTPGREELLKIIKYCWICKRVAPPNSFLCDLGHFTCMDCKDKGICCPPPGGPCTWSCPADLSPSSQLKSVPCHVYKLMYNSLKFRCPERPCKETFSGAEAKDHELNCVGRKNVLCPLTECPATTTFKLSTIISHLRYFHKIPLIDVCGMYRSLVHEWYFKDVGVCQVPFLLRWKERYFVCATTQEVVNGVETLVIALCIAAREEEGMTQLSEEEFQGTIAIHGADNFYQQWTGFIPSVRRSTNFVIMGCHGLILNQVQPASLKMLDLSISEISKDEPQRVKKNPWEPYAPPDAAPLSTSS